MPDIHARLSASGSSRWLNCPPSLLLEESFPDTGSSYAAEGTLAHKIAELKVSKIFFNSMTDRAFKIRLNKLKKHELWDHEMERYTDEYAEYIEHLALGMPAAPYVAVETKVDFGKYAPGGFGTADCVLIQGETIHVCDFKYGKGVIVSPEDNSQLKLYVLGAYEKYAFMYPLKNAVLHIIQPRLGNTDSWEVTISDLLAWGDEVKVIATLALKGEGDFKAGEHCQFCKAKAQCRARAEKNVELAGFIKLIPPLISNDEVGRFLEMALDIQKWVADLSDFALAECLAGREVSGWKAVEGRSNRKITDEPGLAQALLAKGFAEAVIFKPKALETITNLEKLVGKKDFTEIGQAFIEKPPGKPTLVPASDKREPIANVCKANKVFKDIKEDL